MNKLRVHSTIGFACLLLITQLGGVAIAEEHHDSAVFSQVMHAIKGKSCPLLSGTPLDFGNSPAAVQALYVANDNTNFYFLLQFVSDATNNVRTDIFLDVDKNQDTGCQFPSFLPREFSGRDMVISLLKNPGDSYVNRVFNDCSWPGNGDGFDQTGFATAVVGRYIAVILPISSYQQVVSEIGPPGPNGAGFIVQLQGDGVSWPAFYRRTF